MDLAFPVDHGVKLKEIKKRVQYLDLARELKKTVKHESNSDTNGNLCTQWSHQKIITGTGRFANEWTSGDHPNYSIIKIGQNIQKSPGDLRRLAVT